jgi:hypothetical protein
MHACLPLTKRHSREEPIPWLNGTHEEASPVPVRKEGPAYLCGVFPLRGDGPSCKNLARPASSLPVISRRVM